MSDKRISNVARIFHAYRDAGGYSPGGQKLAPEELRWVVETAHHHDGFIDEAEKEAISTGYGRHEAFHGLGNGTSDLFEELRTELKLPEPPKFTERDGRLAAFISAVVSNDGMISPLFEPVEPKDLPAVLQKRVEAARAEMEAGPVIPNYSVKFDVAGIVRGLDGNVEGYAVMGYGRWAPPDHERNAHRIVIGFNPDGLRVHDSDDMIF